MIVGAVFGYVFVLFSGKKKRCSMRISLTAVLFVFAVVAVSLPVRGRSGLVEVTGSAERQAAESARLRIPVVVELFTSEGCSSCPPADELLERLDEKQLIPGVEVIALELHVDYWNSLGWNDPFSSSRFSERQNDYSISFGHSGVYTPQMIVDGTVEFVGSSKQQALASIAESARQPKAKVQLQFGKDRGGDANRVPLSLTVEMLPEVATGGHVDLVAAITEDRVASNISRGENAGLRVVHRAVVRELRTLETLRSNGPVEVQWELRIAKEWKRENLRAVAFLQDRSTRRILGAGGLALGNGG